MINEIKLKEALVDYKNDFNERWKDEKYKWEAIKHFQDNWDIESENFYDMLTKATAKTENLLASMQNYPRGMIMSFASSNPERVRQMFKQLYDESLPLKQRYSFFTDEAENLRIEFGKGEWKRHYQNENAISVYLWLKYPDKYYIYKYSEASSISKFLDSNYQIKKGYGVVNVENGIKLYDEIKAYIDKDKELSNLVINSLNQNCYKDPNNISLVIDVGYYISKFSTKKSKNNDKELISEKWYPENYDSGLTIKKWKKLLQDKTIFTTSRLEVMKRILDFGKPVTCNELANKYGGTSNFYNTNAWNLGKKIHEKTNCPLATDYDEKGIYWPILFYGKNASKDNDGSFLWKLRGELKEALKEIDLSKVNLHYQENKQKKYWWLNCNPKIWSYSNIKVGETQSYTLLNDSGNKRKIYQNFLDVREGDIVIGYESTPKKKITSICQIVQKSDGEVIQFEKTEALDNEIDYKDIKDIPELQNMEFMTAHMGSLFKLTENEYNIIMDLIRDQNVLPKSNEYELYTKNNFLAEVYLELGDYDSLVSLLKYKKNIILQGAPGVGKTYCAKRLAYSILGYKKETNIEFVQFHQNYSYEDFVMGYKPEGDTFELKEGIFYKFCKRAANNPAEDYFFIIDEINRGNMSKIFGELLMLIENGYRDTSLILAYSGMNFSIPKNLYIIGMMNTADRSLAMIDYALRRRFSFFEMKPAFTKGEFKNYIKELGNEVFIELIEKITHLNNEIRNDPVLGSGFCIGHSYFCNKGECDNEWLRQVIDFEILPMLKEYWFDDQNKVDKWEKELLGVFDE